MNKIFTINLGGYPYTVNDDAYERLGIYLNALRRHFSQNPSCQEIINDIEARLAEIFSEKLGTRSIVTIHDVEDAIAIMGMPEDFDAETANATTSANGNNINFRTGKRLYRDGDDKVFAGVCAGLAAYFGVKDPVWVRLGFGISIFVSFGFTVMLYFLLCIILPVALTAADRLAMKGEPANVENIAKVVEKGFDDLSNSFQKGTKTTSAGSQNIIADIFSLIGQLFLGIIGLIKMIGKPIVFFFGVIAFIVLAAFWITFVASAKVGYPMADFAFGSGSFWGYLAYINVFFLIGLALLGIGLLIARLFFKVKVNNYWTVGIGAFWLLNGLSFGIIGANLGNDFNREEEVSQEIFDTTIGSDTLQITLEKDNRFLDIHTQFGPFKFDDKKMLNGMVHLSVEESDDNNYRLVKETIAHGSSREEATQLATNVKYEPRLEGNQLVLPSHFVLENTKYRAQRVEMTLYVPKNKFIKLGKGTRDIVRIDYDWDKYGSRFRSENTAWQMKDGELESPELLSKANFSKKFDLSDFSRLDIKGDAKIMIKQGATYEVEIKGDEEDVNDFEVIKNSNTLKINPLPNRSNNGLTINITMPRLDLLDAENVNFIEMMGFRQPEMKIIANGDFKIEADLEVEKISIDADESAQIVLKGKGGTLDCILGDDAELNARQYEVKTATTSLRNGTNADIYATEVVTNRRDEGDLQVEGGAKIIEESKQKEN
jgi:phage shock protein PspC (stress-responsive transcriptional regulator)